MQLGCEDFSLLWEMNQAFSLELKTLYLGMTAQMGLRFGEQSSIFGVSSVS